MTIDPKREAAINQRLDTLRLEAGSHDSSEDGFCVMELTAYLAGEPHSAAPACSSEVIATFLRGWNDALDDETRQRLRPYAWKVIGTAAPRAVELKRTWILLDWLMRVYTPAWLDLVSSLAPYATAIRARPEVSADTIEETTRVVAEAQRAAAASDAAWDDASWDAARDAARAAAEDAVWDAARAAAEDAAHLSLRDAADRVANDLLHFGAAAEDAARDAARYAARAAARAAAGENARAAAAAVLAPTVKSLQDAAISLLDRLIACKE